MSDDALINIKQTFFLECDELLAELETGLLALKEETDEPDTVNAVFRAVHSIKGGAGAFDLHNLVQFSHAFETALDQLRTGRLAPTPNCMKVFLRASDMLSDLIHAARDGVKDDETQWRGLLVELAAFSAISSDDSEKRQTEEKQEAEFIFEPIAVSLEDILSTSDSDAAGGRKSGYTIYFKPLCALYAKANETGVLLRELDRLGQSIVHCDISAVPLLSELEPEKGYLSWAISLQTDAKESEIRHIFEFVETDCELDIIAGVNEKIRERTEIDLSPPVVSIEPCEPACEPHEAIMDPANAIQAASAEAAHKTPHTAAPVVPATIRVDIERVDRFVDLIGELVINQAMLAQKINETGLSRGSPISVGLDEIERLLRAIQDSAMAIRAQPVKAVFQRMSRVAREAADATGKSVHLITEGENAEVDKTVIERLTDPLTHMIRNAVDHGIETPEKRGEAGKAPEGIVRLSAHHRSGRIVIEVSDDGAGIDRMRVKEIAIKKGLISANASLSDDEIDDLIFHPGFSTSQTVSDMSGRGVGMDVVRRSIQALGGRINITSRRGEGSVFSLSLPLTLAVLDGMVVSVANQTLVLPLTAIVETLMPKPECLQNFGAGSHVILVRDEVTPVIDLGAELGYRSYLTNLSSSVAILVETERGGRRALIVDGILDQRQIVIKSLEGNYGLIPGIAAATILGDGRVALIIDVDAIASGNVFSSKSYQRFPAVQVNA